MATIDQVQRGFAMFVDNQVSGAFEGWQKVLVSGCAGLVAANLPKIIKSYASHPMVSMLGVYDPETGFIDIDTLYNAFVPKMGEEKIPISIPKLGTIKLGRQEFDCLRRYIMEA
jgi:hypothetical protein